MKFSFERADQYIRVLTMGRAVNHPDPMGDLSHFDTDIRAMHRRAIKDGELDFLRLSMESLILSPRGRIKQFAGQQFPFNEEDLLAIFRHAYSAIWPDTPLCQPGDQADMQFVKAGADPLFPAD